MDRSDRAEFAKALTVVSELYGRALSQRLIALYWQVLKQFDWIDVRKAFQAHVTHPDVGQFFPKPADIVRLIEGGGETRALVAWTKVEKAIEQVGIYQSVVFDDPLIHRVLEDMGGWVEVCSLTLERLPFSAREFQKRYMGYVLKKPERYPKYLWGLFERDNTKNGYVPAPPILIGDAGKAKAVLEKGGGVPLLTAPLEKSFSETILAISRKKFEQGEEE